MACRAVVHDEAKHALLQAADYLMLVSDGPSAAQRLIKALNERVAEIAENPDLYGLSRAEGLAEAGYHAALVTSYIILYYVSEDVVHIAWFFHQSQDYARYVLP